MYLVKSVCALHVAVCVWSLHTVSVAANLEKTFDLNEIITPLQTDLTLTRWLSVSRPKPITRCDSLETVNLQDGTGSVSNLPPQWMAACPRLFSIELANAMKLKRLPNQLLANTTQLISLEIVDSALEQLPPDLFYYSPNLRDVDLSRNSLKTFASGMFANSGALVTLNLSRNKLQQSALEIFSAPALQGLHELNLMENPTLHDFCNSSNGFSKLSSLRNLKMLMLERNNITTICRDWRTEMPHLEVLNLMNTRVSLLQRVDLEFVRAVNASVMLQGAPVYSVQFDESDYLTESSHLFIGEGTVEVFLNDYLQCDCSMYWTWRTLRYGRWPASCAHVMLWCTHVEQQLRELEEDELMCPDDGACGSLPSECKCWQRPTPTGSRHLHVSCAGAGLTTVPPQLLNITDTVDLQLAHNRIDRLHLDQLPLKFRKLDLSNNNLQKLDVGTAMGLVKEGRRLNISANPLSCNCSDRETMAVLRDHFLALENYLDVKCADGRALASVSLESCPQIGENTSSPLALVVGVPLTILFVAILASAACFMRRDVRLLGRALLDRAGLLSWRSDDDCMYDAFVSFSHEDEERALEIIRWLESRSPPYRLCLHYRDWVPGRSIPEQISESVLGSRLTIALVSRAFLSSTWARAEFREAHAHALRHTRRRLVVVLLEDRRTLELDVELRLYVALNTYMQWGDTWFWDKLQRALPRPRCDNESNS